MIHVTLQRSSLLTGMTEVQPPRIKNRAPAPIQITAEQLLREAHEHQEFPGEAKQRQRLEDFEELEEFRGRKRKEFEDAIRKLRGNMAAWIRYGTWEASQGQMDRARSVFERALDVDPHHVPLWLRYTEQELKRRNVNHARNLFDRAVAILPRIDQLWYKYVHVEELLGNILGTREIFERWMEWEPDERAWNAYIAFEVRYDDLDRASAVWERAVTCHPEPRRWIRWAKFEEDRSAIDKARNVFHMALDFFGEGENELERAQTVFTAFAKMETRQGEFDRARIIYKYALERLPRAKSEGIYASYTRFEKQFGSIKGVEDTVVQKRRLQYEEEIDAAGGNAGNYDTWFDYTRLEEESFRTLREEGGTDAMVAAALNKVRSVYERGVALVPPAPEKRLWRRYIYLWLRWALFEEADAQDCVRAKSVYVAAMGVVPHRVFTFAKLWINYAYFEVRRLDLGAARKILGTAIGLAPKAKLFRAYIELELSLKEFDRARTLYTKAIEWDASNSSTWVRYAELEHNLFDLDRARAIYELGISQAESELGGLDMPEVLWKAYIDFEFGEQEFERVDALYERLLDKTGHVKVWVSYALGKTAAAISLEEEEDAAAEEELEAAGKSTEERVLSPEEEEYRRERRTAAAVAAREIFQRGYDNLRSQGLKEERVVLLEAWKSFETEYGNDQSVDDVQARMPRVVKRRREIAGGDGAMEEYYDMVFPDDASEAKPSMKLLQMAHAWHAQQTGASK